LLSSTVSATQGGTQSTVVGESAAAIRGKVQKTFIKVKLLSGFMDDSHIEMVIGEYLGNLGADARQAFQAEAIAARAHVSSLSPFNPADAVTRAIQSPYVDAIRADPLFQQSFGQRSHRFAYVDVRQLVALQPWIEPRGDQIPSSESELLAFALPNSWDVPAEVSFFQPQGPIQILTSSPHMQSVSFEFEPKNGTVRIGAPKHLNLVQVVHFNGRHYLMNGYHRVADALKAGVNELPAIVIDALHPQEIQINGPGFFAPHYVVPLPRPPLLADFHGPAATSAKVRERRYGVLIGLDIKPLQISI
jgi:hypothetical protein